MQKFNKATIAVISALITAPNMVYAGSWICEHNNLIREITVQRDTSNPAPCSVIYNKDSEGQGSQSLWNARHDGNFCDAKADEFAEKLKSYGWSCTTF